MNDSTNIGPAEFLDLIHGPEALIYFQVAGKTWKNKPQTFREAEPKLRWRNANGDGICFIVNAGGTKDADITGFNTCFLDWDCGRGPDGRYMEEPSVIVAKAGFRQILEAFPLIPSILVETRNGFHVYWLLEADVSVDHYRDTQRRLAHHLNGDPACVNPARAMRLPGYDWTKGGYARFPVRIISSSAKRYAIDELLGSLPELPTEQKAFRHHNKCSGITTTALIVVSNRQEMSIQLKSMAEAIEYLKAQDLNIYLGMSANRAGTPQAITCPFHSDTNASATVGQDISSGHWLFCCHSNHCRVKGSIIDLEMRRQNTTDIGEALRRLMDFYKIEINTGWKQSEEAILDGNIAILNDPERLSGEYPSLYRWIGRVAQDLNQKLRWAKTLLVSERFQVEGCAIFFMSLREMERQRRGCKEQARHFGRQSQRVDRYCLLGLMRKVPDSDIPADILKEARDHQGRRAHRIQFYSFPAYTQPVLERANDRACQLIAAGASVRGVSRPLVTDLFGKQVADEVYPQQSPEKGDARAKFVERVEAVVVEQVALAGYTTTSRILDGIRGKRDSLIHRRIERVLPGILARNRLQKKTANKEMKMRFSIGGTGYPKIIMPAVADNPSCVPAM